VYFSVSAGVSFTVLLHWSASDPVTQGWKAKKLIATVGQLALPLIAIDSQQ